MSERTKKKIKRWGWWSIFLSTICLVLIIPAHTAMAALTITPGSVNDWTAVAQNTLVESTIVTCSGNYSTDIYIQAFLDTETAHAAGTNFIIHVSSKASGDEDWHYFTEFNALRGTANSEALTANPVAQGATTSAVVSTTGAYDDAPVGKWLGIEDSTLANSELVFQAAFSANASISWLDGTTNEHAQNTLVFDIACSRRIILPLGTVRARVIVDNTVVTAGSTLNYKVTKVDTSAL